MSRPDTTIPVVTAAQQQAALEWLSLLHGRASPADRQAFSRWLQADPAHAEAYADAQVLWEMSEIPAAKLAAEDADTLDALLAAMDAPPRRRLPRIAASLAMAACVLVLVGVGLGWQPQRWVDDLKADYVAAPGQVRSVTLADDSRVTLDADSAIAVRFTGGERHVELRRGAAFFEVTHNGEPFVVDAAHGHTRVLGTRFEVRLRGDGAQVTVLSGKVGVSAEDGPPQQVLLDGQQAHYDRHFTSVPQAVEAERLVAWRDGWLNYYRAPLADVIDDLNRYHAGRILLLNDRLAGTRISGSFPSGDPQAVLEALQSVVGFQQYSLLGRVIVVR